LLRRAIRARRRVAHSKQTAKGEPFAIRTGVTAEREAHSLHWRSISLRGYHDPTDVMPQQPDSRFAGPTEAGDAESSLPRAPRKTARRIGRIPRRGPLPMTDGIACGQYEKAPDLSSFSLGSACIS
jgi:hypothetical protein